MQGKEAKWPMSMTGAYPEGTESISTPRGPDARLLRGYPLQSAICHGYTFCTIGCG